MKLLDRNGFRADEFSRGAGEAAEGAVIVPLAELAETRPAENRRLGVDVANTARVDELAPHFDRLALIAIAFPSFGDGRGFTLAHELRRAGFTGTLRAVGPLIADQFPHALGCGFDEVEIPDELAARQPAEQWLRARSFISLPYQSGYDRPTTILEQRRLASKDVRHA